MIVFQTGVLRASFYLRLAFTILSSLLFTRNAAWVLILIVLSSCFFPQLLLASTSSSKVSVSFFLPAHGTDAMAKRHREPEEIGATNGHESKRRERATNEESNFAPVALTVDRLGNNDKETAEDCVFRDQQLEHLQRPLRLLSLGRSQLMLQSTIAYRCEYARWWRNSRLIVSHNSQTYHAWHK